MKVSLILHPHPCFTYRSSGTCSGYSLTRTSALSSASSATTAAASASNPPLILLLPFLRLPLKISASAPVRSGPT